MQKNLIYIAIILLVATNCFGQKNLAFERWDIDYYGVDDAKNWINIADASKYGAPKVLFKEVDNPSEGLASINLKTVYWQDGAEFGVDTLVGSVVQQTSYNKRPKGFEFDYKAFPKLGDEVLIGIQLTKTVNDSLIVIGEGFFSSSTLQETWKTEKVTIHYYSHLKPEEISIIALSSANATILDGSLGYAKIGSELFLDNLKLSTEISNPKKLGYFVHVFPNPAKEFINISSNSSNEQTIKIYSLSGKLVMESSFTSKTQLDISSLSTGTYIYNVIDKSTNEISVSNKFNIVK